MAPDTVSVPEASTVQTSPRKALRLFVGKFIVDFVETFAALAGTITLFLPTNIEDWRKQALLLATPAAAALISSARRSWPTVKAWLLGTAAATLVGSVLVAAVLAGLR